VFSHEISWQADAGSPDGIKAILIFSFNNSKHKFYYNGKNGNVNREIWNLLILRRKRLAYRNLSLTAKLLLKPPYKKMEHCA
jgi:hypothetical protein